MFEPKTTNRSPNRTRAMIVTTFMQLLLDGTGRISMAKRQGPAVAVVFSLSPKPGDERREDQAGQVIGQFDSFQFQDDQRDAENQQTAGRMHGIEQRVVAQERS